MRRILVDSIKGNELLAKDIVMAGNKVIMATGHRIKKDYIPKFIELGITAIYVEDEYSQGIHYDKLMEDNINEQCESIVKDILDKYSYQGYGQLKEIKEIAEEIIGDVLKQKEVIYSVSGMRRNSETLYSHSVNVCALSVLIALRLKLSKNKIKDIAVGALLHDIGMNKVNFSYEDRDWKSLDDLEHKEFMKHVIYGYSTVEKETWISQDAKEIILCHHERMDGSGYPFHKKGDKIKIGSKIVAVCDIFDRMVYGHMHEKMKVHDAINYIMSQGSIKYDFEVVKVFYNSVAAYPNGTCVITSDGDLGIVLSQNDKFPTRPIIRLLKNSAGITYSKWEEKDLTKELTLFIRDTINL